MRPFVLAGVVALALVASGCLEVDGALDARGSGTLRLTYVPPRRATIQSETARFSAPKVHVGSVRSLDHRGIVELSFDDVTALPTAEALSRLRVSRTRSGAEETLRIVLPSPEERERVVLRGRMAANPTEPGPRIALELPGDVLRATEGGEAKGTHVAWVIPLTHYLAEPWLDLRVSYRVADHSM